MIQTIKSIFIVTLTALGALLVGCSDPLNNLNPNDLNDPLVGERLVTVKANAQFGNLTPSAGRVAAVVALSDFIVNVKEIELKIDERDERSATDTVYTDAEFYGPFVLDLLSDTLADVLASVVIPPGIYDQVEFKLTPSQDPTSGIEGKSVYMTGEIDGTPFVFWSDISNEVEVNFPNNGGDLELGSIGVVLEIVFDLDALFGPNGAIDLSQAVDGNGDGVIEIYPGDPDGNSLLSIRIMSQLEEATELEEDEDLDEDGEGNSEDDDIDGDGVENDEDDDDDNDGINDDEDDDDDGDGEDDDAEDDDHDDDGDHDEDEGESDEDDDDEQELSNIMSVITNGTWVISDYENPSDPNANELLAQLDSFTFTFDATRIYATSSDSTEYGGSWEAITNIDDPFMLIDFDSDEGVLFHVIEGDWIIDELENNELKLEKYSGDAEKSLKFQKL